MELLVEAAELMGGQFTGARVEKRLPGGVVLVVEPLFAFEGLSVRAAVNISVPGRFFLKLVEEENDPEAGEKGRPAPPPFDRRYRMWGSPPARAEEVVRRVAAPLDEVRPHSFGIGLQPVAIGTTDTQLSAVTAQVDAVDHASRVARVASLVDEVARRLDPLAFAAEGERSQRLAQSLAARLPWASPDAGAGHGALRARFVLEELGERVSAEARVSLSRVQARLTFRGALPRGARLHLAPRRGLLGRLRRDKLRSGDDAVDRALSPRAPDDAAEAGAALRALAPALAELLALEGPAHFQATVDLEPDALVVVSGEMSRGSVLPYLESLVWSWRAMVGARVGQEAAIPSVSWFG